MPVSPNAHPLLIIGWQECISLPALGLHDMAIKVDTGAKTTALHAENITTFTRDGALWVRFDAPAQARTCEFAVFTKREITNTSGQPEQRIVIRTPMILAGRQWKIDISLTDRAAMLFPLILGRRALRQRNIAVHTRQTYLVSPMPPVKGAKP